MRFYIGTLNAEQGTLNDVWRELYPPEEYPTAKTLDDVRDIEYKFILILTIFTLHIHRKLVVSDLLQHFYCDLTTGA